MTGHRVLRRSVLTAAGVLALAASRRVLRNWGATKLECRTLLPGDDLVADPADVTTRCVDVAAPADLVWSELVELVQEGRSHYKHLQDGYLLPVVDVEPTRTIVMFSGTQDLVRSLHVHSYDSRARLTARSRAPHRSPLHRLLAELREPIRFLQTRRILLLIKHRAEEDAALHVHAAAATSAAPSAAASTSASVG